MWWPAGAGLPTLAAEVRALASGVDHTMLEESTGSPQMEDVAAWFLARARDTTRVIVRRPTLGFAAEARREPNPDR